VEKRLAAQTQSIVRRPSPKTDEGAQTRATQSKGKFRFAIKMRRSARPVEIEARHLTMFGDLDSTWLRGMVYDYFPDEEQANMLRRARDYAGRSTFELEVSDAFR
jgi:hypothetical protein